MWHRRRRMPAELAEALRAARRQTRRERTRTQLWRLRLLLRRLRLPAALLLLLGVVAACVALRGGPLPWTGSPGQEAALPRVIYGTPSAPQAVRLSLRATVVDGDTLAAGDQRLRLHAIDAPEMGQTCTRDGRPYACGEEARRAMARIIGTGMLACEALDLDRYGRRIARCTNAAGQDIAAALVAQGWAIAYRRFGEDYVAQEEEARRQRRGLWAGSFDTPEQYRQRGAR